MTRKEDIAGAQFARLVDLERSIRAARTPAALHFAIVNETRRLVAYRQAALLIRRGNRLRTIALSDIPEVDRTAPLVQWLERVVRTSGRGGPTEEIRCIDPADLDPRDAAAWSEFGPDRLIRVPLASAQRGFLGVLVLAMEAAPTAPQRVLLEHLAATFAHALQVFQPAGGGIQNAMEGRPRRLMAYLAAAILVFSFAYRVHLTALAPMEIVPTRPFVVTSPLDGVIQQIAVKTNQPVQAGDRLAVLDDTELRNRCTLAEKALEVARAEYDRAGRGAFVDARSQAVLAELEAQVEARRAEVAYARERLSRTTLLAERAGVAITPPPEQWEGRPVRVGEAIMQIADPRQVEARILLPVKDAVLLDAGGRVRLFLDSNPLDPIGAAVLRAEYLPEVTPAGNFAYRIAARLEAEKPVPRIGLRGTAKMYGPSVSLFYYLFRRPLTYLRQMTGL